MKALFQVRVMRPLRAQFARLISQRFFSDRLSLTILVPTLVLNVLNILLLLVRVHAVDVPVPVHYSSLSSGFDALGPWYQVYYIALFGLLTTLVNAFLAIAGFNRSRITSFFLLIGAFVVALFCLIISSAFAAVVVG